MVCQQIKKTCEDWNHDTSDWISQPPITNLSWNAEMTIWGKVAHLQGWCSWVGDAAQICIRHKLGKYLPHLPFAVFPILKWNKTQGQDGNENPDGQNEWINTFFLNSLSSTSLSFTWPHAYVTIVGLSDSLYIAMCTSLWRSDIISTTTWVLNVWRAQIKLKSKS